MDVPYSKAKSVAVSFGSRVPAKVADFVPTVDGALVVATGRAATPGVEQGSVPAVRLVSGGVTLPPVKETVVCRVMELPQGVEVGIVIVYEWSSGRSSGSPGSSAS